MKVLDEYQKAFGDSWKAATKDATDAAQQWPFLTDALTKFQVKLSMNKNTICLWFH
jgi:synaptobrevin family protein YKT6